ncbi:MAG: DUF192 domain-containing protein [Deltaproteobacteria bacterium]|nr:DUF192 domain-containing protein [Deltaproteobacteria bacterium]
MRLLPRLVFVLAPLALLMLSACPNSGKKNTETPQDPPKSGGGALGARQQTLVTIFEAGGRTLRVSVEVVRKPAELARGLMYRKELAPMAGMLFIFSRLQVQSFWMKNTYIPLDMIFVDETMKVVGLVENAGPMTLDSRRIEAPSRYVVEVNAGFCKKHGVVVGTTMRVEGIEL